VTTLARRLAWNLTLPLAIVAVIAWATTAHGNVFFPPLGDVVAVFPETWNTQRLSHDVLPSLWRLAAGLGIGVVAAITVGTTLGMSPRLGWVADPVLAYLRSLPAPAIIPLLLVLFGVGDATKVVTIALGTTWPMLLNTMDGVRSVPLVQRESMAVLRLGRLKRWWLCFRYASPRFFAGARQAISLAIIIMVVSEMVMSSNGLGYSIIQFQRSYAITRMWSGVILLGALGIVASWAGETLQRRATRWHTAMSHATEMAR
jgi:ABC-type nitrate/sulfonate/bicarbonate transport system permease component